MSKGKNINRNVLFLEDWFGKAFVKMPSLVSFAQMEAHFIDAVYKIFAKVMTNRLHKVLPFIIHNAQYGFFTKRDLLHNILNVQIAIYYDNDSKQ